MLNYQRVPYCKLKRIRSALCDPIGWSLLSLASAVLVGCMVNCGWIKHQSTKNEGSVPITLMIFIQEVVPTRNDPSVGDDSGSWENHPYKSRCSNMGLSVLGWHFSMGIHANPGWIHHPCWFFGHPGSSQKIMLFSPLTTIISCYIPHNPWIPLVYPQWIKL